MKKRLYYLDFIKVFALILVFVCHFTRSLESNGVGYVCKVLPDRMFNLYIGSFGVSLFFIASGASLMYVYEEKLLLGQYFKKRFTGIYPMFWLAFLSATCISLFRNIGIDINIPKWKIIYSVLGIDGNALWWGINFYQLGEWFLSVIICLYIIFPLLRIVVLKYPVLSVIGSVMILTGCIVFFKSRMPVECFVAARILEFVLGMLFVRYIKAGDFRWGGAGLAGLVLAALVDFGVFNVMIQTVLVGLSAFMVLAWIGEAATKVSIIRMVSLVGGKYCFPFFLTHHYLCEWLTERFSGNTLRRSEVYLLCFACFCLTVAVSRVLFDVNRELFKCLTNSKKSEG